MPDSGPTASVEDQIASLVRAAGVPGADVLGIAQQLAALSAELASAGRPGEAVGPQQALVEVLAGFSPAAAQRLDYLITVAEGRHNLIARLIADQQVEAAAGLAGQAVADYRAYAAEPGADVMRAARDLGALSAELASAGRPGEAVGPQQALVEVLAGFSPAAAQRLDYLITVAEGRHNLIARLIADQQVEAAAGLAGQAVADYRAYAAEPGADVMRAARDLGALSAELASAGRPGEAVGPQQALVEVLAGFSPAAAQRLDYLITVAEGRHNLIARLIADQQVEAAAGLAGQAVADYRAYAAEPGADVMRAARDLGALSAELASAGRPGEAVGPQQALVEVLAGFSPAAAQRLDYLITVAEGRHNLIARLIADQQVEAAAGLAGQAVADYRAYAAEPGADVMRAARDLGALSAELASAGRPGEAVGPQQALVEVLAGFSPAAAQRLDYLITVAEGRHNLIARLIADQQVEAAAGLAGQAVADYRAYAAEPGADVMRAARDLGALSAELASAGRPREAVTAMAECVSIHVVHGDNASREDALANLAGLYARAPGLRIMRAVLATADVDLLRSVVLEFRRDVDAEGGIRLGADGVARVECYAPNETLEILRARGIAVEIVADQTAIGLARRDVVVQGNRFADGTIPPGVGMRI